MSVKNPHELFVMLLSNVREGTERTTKIFQEISQVAQNPDVKEALEARAFVSQRTLEKLDQCFKLIGEQAERTPYGGIR
jgi:ferritin-like metal-binding protein YciE